MKIVDVTPENVHRIEQIAELLFDAFIDTGSTSWLSMEDALNEVQESFQAGRISRIAIDAQGDVLGWIGGIEDCDGDVWALHPLVVHRQRQGIGRALVADFEEQVARRGAHTIRLGTGDENNRTSLGGIDLYPDVLEKLRAIKNLRSHPFEFYLKI